MGEHELIFAHFFFVDIVGLSDPKTAAAAQIKKLNFLNQCISQSKAFRSVSRKDKVVLPTGDGMAIAFLRGAELPLELAIELNIKIRKYNVGKLGVDSIDVRIGIHSGSCFLLKDLNKNDNVWGPGIILARRCFEIADGVSGYSSAIDPLHVEADIANGKGTCVVEFVAGISQA